MSKSTRFRETPNGRSTASAAVAKQHAAVTAQVERILGSMPDDRIAAFSADPERLEVALRAAFDTAALIPVAANPPHQASPLHGNPSPPSFSSATHSTARQESHLSSQQDELITVAQFAERAGVRSKQTVRNWIERQIVVGWPSAKNSFVLPADQLDDAGRPVKGFDRVLPVFGDARLAWEWLKRPLHTMDGNSPLTLLHRGQTEQVCRSAQAFADGSYG